jgi:potassium-transporting ATPase KdpC subunit
MRRVLLSSVIAVVVFTLVFGLAYPLLFTGVSQVIFPGASNGSKLERNGTVVGSELIGQDFKRNPRYFQSRPSATGYTPDVTFFGNLGPNSKDARAEVRKNIAAYLALEKRYDPSLTPATIPVDAVTQSASGVDPHISQDNARIQAHRIAAVRRLPMATVDKLIDDNVEGRFLGVFGEPGVNVLELNLALDKASA